MKSKERGKGTKRKNKKVKSKASSMEFAFQNRVFFCVVAN